jgi:hypothetical protein
MKSIALSRKPKGGLSVTSCKTTYVLLMTSARTLCVSRDKVAVENGESRAPRARGYQHVCLYGVIRSTKLKDPTKTSA